MKKETDNWQVFPLIKTRKRNIYKGPAFKLDIKTTTNRKNLFICVKYVVAKKLEMRTGKSHGFIDKCGTFFSWVKRSNPGVKVYKMSRWNTF